MARKTSVDSVRKYGGKAGGKLYRAPRKVQHSDVLSVLVAPHRGAFIWDIIPADYSLRGHVGIIEAGVMTVYQIMAHDEIVWWDIEQHLASLIPYIDIISLDNFYPDDIPF